MSCLGLTFFYVCILQKSCQLFSSCEVRAPHSIASSHRCLWVTGFHSVLWGLGRVQIRKIDLHLKSCFLLSSFFELNLNFSHLLLCSYFDWGESWSLALPWRMIMWIPKVHPHFPYPAEFLVCHESLSSRRKFFNWTLVIYRILCVHECRWLLNGKECVLKWG